MCGIAGIFGWTTDREDLETRLGAMECALAHRGPDDRGLWVSPDALAGICHTRLSILDLSAAGHQPMQRGPLQLVFNGEIYNYRELRDTLERSGEHFTSQSDTEVILQAYRREQESCLEKFDGMFAFAIYDAEKREGILARDPFGIKPLYYHYANGHLVFASELRTLLASGLVEGKLCPLAVDSFLRCGSVQEPNTAIAEVRALPAGSYLKWTREGITISEFAKITFPETGNVPDAVALTREAFQKTIRRHLVSDVPVGIFLSGGIDSSCIAKAVMQEVREPLHSFSIAVEDAALNEAPTARRFAEEIGTTHHEYLLREEEVPSLFNEYLAALDQPSIDGFNTYCVSRFARENGAKVVLSGLGGDEIFGGYGTFFKVPQLWNLSKLFSFGNPLARMAGKLLENPLSNSKIRRSGEWMQQPPSVEASYHLVRSIFSQKQAQQLERIAGWKNPPKWIPAMPPAFRNPRDQVSYLETTSYMRNQLLKDSDVMSMAHGLELRVPLVDWEFFQTVATIPADVRCAPGKQLLVQAVGGLPEWITTPPKRGFLFPFDQWSKHLWKDYTPSVLNIKMEPHWPWSQSWAICVLDDWMKRNNITL